MKGKFKLNVALAVAGSILAGTYYVINLPKKPKPIPGYVKCGESKEIEVWSTWCPPQKRGQIRLGSRCPVQLIPKLGRIENLMNDPDSQINAANEAIGADGP